MELVGYNFVSFANGAIIFFNLAYGLIGFYRYLVTCDAGDASFIPKLGAVKVSTGVMGDNVKGFEISIDPVLFQYFLCFFS